MNIVCANKWLSKAILNKDEAVPATIYLIFHWRPLVVQFETNGACQT